MDADLPRSNFYAIPPSPANLLISAPTAEGPRWELHIAYAEAGPVLQALAEIWPASAEEIIRRCRQLGLQHRPYQAKRIMTSADVIADDLRARITSGELRLHHRFPTERELIEHYDSNTEVVRAAKSLLIGEGLIGRAGRGTKAGLTVLRTPPTISARRDSHEMGFPEDETMAAELATVENFNIRAVHADGEILTLIAEVASARCQQPIDYDKPFGAITALHVTLRRIAALASRSSRYPR